LEEGNTPQSPLYDLTRFALTDMTRLGAELRKAGTGADSLEGVANRLVRLLYEQLTMPPGKPACALARLFVTVPFAQLEPPLQEFAARLQPDIRQRPAMRCLTLMASAGEVDAWNARTSSEGHQALPLVSAESVGRSPMINQLIRQLGVEVGTLVAGDTGMMLDSAQHTFNVFHVPKAPGSPFIPAQDNFVKPFGVQSVIGFGGLLPPGELFAAILFTKTHVPREVAELFKTLALNAKVALMPFAETRLFA